MFGGRAWYEELISDLASLLDAGVPLIEALETLAGGRPAATVHEPRPAAGPAARLAFRLLQEVTDGHSLAEAFQFLADEIPPVHAALVAAGERSGRTSDMLRRIVQDIRRRQELRPFSGSLTRTWIRLSGTIAAVLLLAPILATSGIPGWHWIYVAVLAGAFITFVLIRTGHVRLPSLPESVRQSFFNVALALPWLGEQLRLRWHGRGLWLLGTLLEAGLPLSEALPLVAEATSVDRFRIGYRRVGELVRDEKNSLAQALSHLDFFRLHFHWLTHVSAGEKAGRLDSSLLELSQIVDNRAQTRGRVVAALIPIALLLAIGAAVLVYGLVVFSKIYDFEV